MTINKADQEPIAAYQVLINDWVLVAPNPASREQWHKVLEVSHHPEGLGTDLVVIRANGPMRMALQNVLYAMRSETQPADPPSLDDQAREILIRNYPDARFRITRRAGGLTLSWADGPTPQEVAGSLRCIAAARLIRWRRSLSMQQRAVNVVRDAQANYRPPTPAESAAWSHRAAILDATAEEQMMARALLTLATANRRGMQEQLDEIGLRVLQELVAAPRT